VEWALWREEVQLAPVTASRERHAVRGRLYLHLTHDDVEGFGEISPQPRALNGDPGESEVIDELVAVVMPQLAEALVREGGLPHWTRLARFAGSRPASPFAVALVEMAVLDRQLRAEGRTLVDLWAPRYDTPVQATVSLLDDEPWRVDGAARVRAKSAAGALDEQARERLGALTVPVLVDFNCAGHSPEEVLAQVAELEEVCDLAGVEQPFGAANLVDHAALAARCPVPLSLDEGVRASRDVERIARYHAADIVCVKPARVGGLANAHSVVLRARERGLRPYLGGFFESEFARRVHATLARHCVEEPSDLGAVGRTRGPRTEAETRPDGLGVGPVDLVGRCALVAP
jgi:L-alanine-DL-glutamate epimerase-like enolase superfamily enzyme